MGDRVALTLYQDATATNGVRIWLGIRERSINKLQARLARTRQQHDMRLPLTSSCKKTSHTLKYEGPRVVTLATKLILHQLWMGTHPSNPSKDLTTGRTLLDLVQDNQALMSTSISKRYQQKLPFLFKVLSINKALSIQAHPNKKLAEQLYARDSKNYPDDNHKPEMTIAITPFDGLCGFRPLAEIAHFLQTVPSLRQLVGEDEASKFEKAVKGQETSDDSSKMQENKKALQRALTSLMESKPEEVEKLAPQLIQQAKEEGSKFAGGGGPSNDGQELADLMVRLDEQFPADIGLFVTFFLNYIKLEVGEAMFLKADDIHAYLSGGQYFTSSPRWPSTNFMDFRHHRMHGEQ